MIRCRLGHAAQIRNPLPGDPALLVEIAAVLLLSHNTATGAALVTGAAQMVAGVMAGFAIDVVASLLGVAGGQLLIPALVLLFGADIKLAGSLSLAVSLPTMLVGFTRYSCDQSFSVIGRTCAFLLVMAIGSVAGTLIGGLLLGLVPAPVLLPLLAAILAVSAVKVWRHAVQMPLFPHARRTSPLTPRADCNDAVREWLQGVGSRS